MRWDVAVAVAIAAEACVIVPCITMSTPSLLTMLWT